MFSYKTLIFCVTDVPTVCSSTQSDKHNLSISVKVHFAGRFVFISVASRWVATPTVNPIGPNCEYVKRTIINKEKNVTV